MVDPAKIGAAAGGFAALLNALRGLFGGGSKKPPPKVEPVEVEKLDREKLLGRRE